MEVFKLEKVEEEVTVLVSVGSPDEARTQQGAVPRVKAAKSSESKEGE